tara:strand:- start:859 stop:1698 length:840 start_codon:yes stop_codon:yes gene_type:complete
MSTFNYKSKKYICQNCGNKNHHYKDCKEPKKSYGIILYNINKHKKIEYLMICRRNTIGYVQFIRGQYINSDITYIQKLFDVMSNYEIKLISQENFDVLWEHLWFDKLYCNYSDRARKDKISSKDKFLSLSNGFVHNNKNINIAYFIENKSSFYDEPEWEFPKGRKNINESEYETALREFKEETGISTDHIINITKEAIFNEEYKSYDNVTYNNKYYITKYNSDIYKFNVNQNNKEQYTEVSNIQFIPYEQALKIIRNYCETKKEMLIKINSYIEKLENK